MTIWRRFRLERRRRRLLRSIERCNVARERMVVDAIKAELRRRGVHRGQPPR